MFITLGNGQRVNLNLVKHFWPDAPNDAGLIDCKFEFIDGTGTPGTITADQLTYIDLAFASRGH